MRCPNSKTENEGYCPSDDRLEVHHTDQYSTYYCQSCGYEEKVVWDNPKDSPKRRERAEHFEPVPPPPKKKRRRDERQ